MKQPIVNMLADQVYISNLIQRAKTHRRIIATLGYYVYYSDGGDTNKSCLKTTFCKWISDSNASIVQHEG